MENTYKAKLSPAMLADFFWNLKRDTPNLWSVLEFICVVYCIIWLIHQKCFIKEEACTKIKLENASEHANLL